MSHPFRLLFVCTGNLCRSPLAQALMMHELDQRGVHGIEVGSAGVRARPGLPMDPTAIRVLQEKDIAVPPFRSRLLVPEFVERSDLVLTGARSHRQTIGEMVPDAYGRVFTLTEFVNLLQHVDVAALRSDAVERALALVAAVGDQRGLHAPLSPEELDIQDPIGQRVSAFRRCLTQLHDAVGHIADALDTGALRQMG